MFTYNRGYETVIGLGDVYSSAAYSLDSGQTWTWFTYNESSTEDRDTTPKTTPVIRAGETIVWKFENWDAIGGDYCSDVGSFSSSGRFKVYGNLYEELYDDYYGRYYLAAGIFRNCDKLVDAENLILCVGDTQYINCDSLFYGCTSLVKAPKLPATTLDNNSSYAGMFYGCTSLTTAPELPATTLASNCYNSMFYNCTSLTTVPELPATTLVNYCYDSMFQGCSNLNYIKAMFTTTPSGSSPNYYTSNWVKGVAANGTFVKNSAATWTTRGVNGIPNGWTVETASA